MNFGDIIIGRIIRSVLFCALFCILLWATNWVIVPNIERDAVLKEYSQLPPQSVQVLATGTSKIHSNINPAVIWQKSAITVFDVSGSGMDLQTTYHYLNYCLKLQSPKIVLVDTTSMGANVELNAIRKKNVTNLPGLFARTRAGYDVLGASELEYWTLPLEQSHQRAFLSDRPINRNDFSPIKWGQRENVFLGYWAINVSNHIKQSNETIYISETLYQRNYAYMLRIMKLIENKGARPILITTPDTRPYWMAPITNRLKADLTSDGISVDAITPLDYQRDIGLDYKLDFYDPWHLSHEGATKFSTWLASYLETMLEPIRFSAKTSPWEKASTRFIKWEMEMQSSNENLGSH